MVGFRMSNLQRIEQIKKLIQTQEKDKNRRTFTVRWKDQNIHLTVIRVDTSFLRYRLENGRTRRKQIEYLQKFPHLPQDLFEDPESKSAQDAQHVILKEMIEEAGLRQDIKDEGQRDPAIITYDGFVVNGNRRLAALREENESNMDCVVLPEDATPKDIYELELYLQMAKETKAPYNWVDELLNIRYGIDILGESNSAIAKKMKHSPQQIQLKIDTLLYIDLFLNWWNKPGQYHLVQDVEQIFGDLAKYTPKLKGHERQTTFRNMVFNLIVDKPETGRVYGYVADLYKNFDSTVAEFSTNISGIVVNVEENAEQKTESKQSSLVDNLFEPSTKYDDPLDAISQVDDVIETTDVPPNIVDVLKKPDSEAKITEAIVEAIETASDKARDKKDKEAAFKAVSEAQRKLQSIRVDSTTLKIKSIRSKLVEIRNKSDELLKKIDAMGE